MKLIYDMGALLIIAALVVLVIKNPKGFATDVTALGGVVANQTQIFTGTNYK